MLELVQFRYSPYNEKVRWALDYKRIPHRRQSVLPGPHVPRVKRLTGRTTTPVLIWDGEARDGSTALIDWLEERVPNPALWPTDATANAAARAIVRHFDEDIAPRMRRAILATLLETPRYFARVFADGRGPFVRSLYGLTVPFAAPLVRRGNGISGAASVADGLHAFDEALGFVAERTAADGYLIGNTFSAADLTAAAVLATGVDPPDSPMARPRPFPAPFAALIERHAAHPGAQWVRIMYARHRGARHDFEGATDYAGVPA